MVNVGVTKSLTVSHEKSGNANGGRPCGMLPKRLPRVSTGSSKNQAKAVRLASAMIGPGIRALSLAARRMPGRSSAAWIGERSPHNRGQMNKPTTQAVPRPNAYGLKLLMFWAIT